MSTHRRVRGNANNKASERRPGGLIAVKKSHEVIACLVDSSVSHYLPSPHLEYRRLVRRMQRELDKLSVYGCHAQIPPIGRSFGSSIQIQIIRNPAGLSGGWFGFPLQPMSSPTIEIQSIVGRGVRSPYERPQSRPKWYAASISASASSHQLLSVVPRPIWVC